MRSLSLLIVLSLAACGGAEPVEIGLREAPQWMTEADLPGCEEVTVVAGQVELLLHPFDRELVVVTSNETPTCIGPKSWLVGLTAPGSGPSADDDPIPLVREPDHGEGESGGESSDPPAPPMQLAKQGPASDDPIPLVRPRESQLNNEAVSLLPKK